MKIWHHSQRNVEGDQKIGNMANLQEYQDTGET
jgi:hypothetical protein